MAGLLISGPAGGNKSLRARQEWEKYKRVTGGTAALADFQQIYVALTGDIRGRDGRFPLRDPALLPLTEYIRRAVIGAATARDIFVVATNSDGRHERRQEILGFLGAGATEVVLDPGRATVAARLSDPASGALSDECAAALNRWYGG